MMRYPIFLLSFLIIGCKQPIKDADIPAVTEAELEKFLLPDSVYVILEPDSDLPWAFKDEKPATLSEAELIEIEKILEKAIEENNHHQREMLEQHNKNHPDRQIAATGYELRTEGYKRQYVPIINSKGQKEIWINFFCGDDFKDSWRKGVVWVLDGGNCYFNLKINLATKTYSELMINGYA